VSFQPNVIVMLGANEAVTEILANVEQKWESASFRPYYVLPGLAKLPETLALAKNDSGLRVRMRGTAPGRKTDEFDGFALRYKGKYGSAPDSFGAANGYDAAYVLSYAMASLGDVPISGPAIATGLGMTVGGKVHIDAGPNPVNEAFKTLSSGSAIDFDG